MPRPTVTKEMVKIAAKEVCARIRDAEPEDIAECYSYPMDGYQLAKALEQKFCWDIRVEDVSDLDAMDYVVRTKLTDAEKEWVARENITPKLQPGTVIKRGVISGVSDYGAAMYKVKEHGCTNPSRHLLVRFEDAEAEHSASIAA